MPRGRPNIFIFTRLNPPALRSFLKYFLAALLALVVFFSLVLVVILTAAGSLMNREREPVPARSVLYVDLSRHYPERKVDNPLSGLTGGGEDETPTLYELVRLIRKGGTDTAVKGLYLLANDNGNGYAASEEIRSAVDDFRKSGKFVIAYGDYMTQGAYHVANAAGKVYCNPKGMLDWRGFSVQYVYFRNLLKKLEVEPQIFYDGKFKSATEPFREEKMTAANRVQTEAWLGDMYRGFLMQTAAARHIDTSLLHGYANRYEVETSDDAFRLKLIDGLRYDDEVKEEIKHLLRLGKEDKISFLMPGAYLSSVDLNTGTAKEKIAIVYAEGEIVYGKGEDGQVSSEDYRSLIRKIRYNKDVKAIVLRVNSPGGSSLASEIIWRELSLARASGIPVVVSMGDVAASGGYYISCNADSILAEPNTLTGSIGVFTIIPNFQSLLKNKLGITFDGVKTATYADAMTVTRPLTDPEKRFVQREVDRIYTDFKSRVAEGRRRDTAYIDSIAQGRVWTGSYAVANGLVDRLGHIDDAIRAAARLARLKEYSVREYPEPRSFLDIIRSRYSRYYRSSLLEKELGTEEFRILSELRRLRESSGEVMARLPYSFTIH
jgi:protease-4